MVDSRKPHQMAIRCTHFTVAAMVEWANEAVGVAETEPVSDKLPALRAFARRLRIRCN